MSGDAVAPAREPGVPWQRSSGDGTHYVSFAEWACPIICVEPPMCPAIRLSIGAPPERLTTS